LAEKGTVEFAREAALVQLKLQLESLISIAKNCLATVKLLEGGPAASTKPKPFVLTTKKGLLSEQVLAGMPAAIRPKLTAVLTSYGSVAVTAPWMTPEEYAEVNEAVRAMGGERITAGKASRWEVPVPAGEERGD
jgi:hypothetical protein